jgi:uncharacterized phage protein (TIGR02218 family)
MPKTIPIALLNHYRGYITSLCTCWKVSLRNGEVRGYTTHFESIVVDGVTYTALGAFNPTAIESTSEMTPGNMEISGPLTAPSVEDEDIHTGIWDYAAIEVFKVNFKDTSMGKEILRKGTLGEMRTKRAEFQVELRDMMQALSTRIVRLTSKECDAQLGDARCKVNVALFTVTGTVDGVTDNRIITDAGRIEDADYFTAGLMTFTDGLNEGLSMEVKIYTVGSIELHEEMPFAIVAGDGYSLVAGCSKRLLLDCKAKFNNVVNNRGFEYLPLYEIFETGGTDRV